MKGVLLPLLALLAACSQPPPISHGGPTADWPTYGNDGGGEDAPARNKSSFQATPLMVDCTLCANFGNGGRLNLAEGIEPYNPSDYGVTSPPAVLNGKLIVGSAIGDNQQVEEASGIVRAYDARTGSLVWGWAPIPRDPEQAAAQGWRPDQAARNGAGNAWSILSVDEERDLVFVPTGSVAPDFYGGERLGDNRWADSVVALRGETGQLVWGFQTVHHDRWDYDGRPACPDRRPRRRPGRSGGYQDGLGLSAPPRDRRTLDPRRRTPRSRHRCAGRAGFAYPAVPRQSAPAEPA